MGIPSLYQRWNCSAQNAIICILWEATKIILHIGRVAHSGDLNVRSGCTVKSEHYQRM